MSDLINALITSVDNEVKGTKKTCKILQEIQRFQKRQRGIFDESNRRRYRKGGPNYGIENFTSFSDLKPKYLEKEANLIEVNNWIRQLTHYINAGYRNNPPAKGVYVHLSPL